VEEWIPADGFDLDPELKSIAQEQDSQPMEKEEYKRRYAEWIAACDKAKADNQPLPPEPAAPKAAKPAEAPSSLFNGMIAPLLPCAIRGVIWYQGESNTRNAPLYRKLFPAMIRSWRDSWGQGDFPFLFVQLPGFLLKKSAPSQSAWAELREAQAVALKLPKTAMAVTIDIGDEHNLHPANKQDVGKRLALAAQANVYGQNIASSGPVFASSKVEGDKIAVTFKQTEGGLVVKGGGPPKGFAIAGADKQFVWADAEIDGDKVIVHSAQVPHPVSVRYAWADDPDANLYNRADLPAGPFRLDDW
jgi:sialate O-acetylesterase